MPPRRNVPARDNNDVSAMDRMAIAMEQMAEFMMAQQVHNQAQVQPRVDITKAIANRRPPYYAGEEDLVILEEWIRTFDKLLNAVNCPEEQRVSSAVYYLTKAADNWWTTVGPNLLRDPGFGWEEFKGELRGQFYTERIKGIKCEEFLQLKQQGTTIQVYHDKYVELMRFAQDIVPDEASQARRFVRGLDWGVRSAIAPFMCSTLKEAYNRASDHYQVYLDQQAVYGRSKRKAEDKQGQSEWSNKKPSQGESNPRQGYLRGETSQGRNQTCRQCGRSHPGVTCLGEKIICYQCGREGHTRRYCSVRPSRYLNQSPNKNQEGEVFRNPRQEPFGASNSRMNVPPQARQGRLTNVVPNPNNRERLPFGASSTGNQGRIYVVNSAQTQASDVGTGTFPINSVPGLVLFNTGATNSFISSLSADKWKSES
ncbi:uncharacterized protein LOC116023755 [Ipomoea triloba]|uniref:uncharacterized protein LOC116023755 n=1 Tax=Ipomoea triloba TaxID=35885 RepID=UPI00125D5FE8|nr:uncharacterized protein LOC116023755 [Ipomoea triloba]